MKSNPPKEVNVAEITEAGAIVALFGLLSRRSPRSVKLRGALVRVLEAAAWVGGKRSSAAEPR
jgi:hypothetical protein